MMDTGDVLEVTDLKVHFEDRSGRGRPLVRAVDGVSLTVKRGMTVGLVGESGSGKTTAGLAAIGLSDATGGTVRFAGEDLNEISAKRWRELRSELQIVFQDPYSSLDPRMRVRSVISEPLRVLGDLSRPEAQSRVATLLDQVGLPASIGDRYPHELSGGQRQRVSIARAIALRPALLVCDEPTSALDVSVQAQIIALLRDLQTELDLGLLFISHDLAVIRHISHTVSVMYVGKIVETAETETLFDRPLHPYTQALISAAPVPDPEVEAKRLHTPLQGEIPDSSNPPSGCRFRTRCRYAIELCAKEEPLLTEVLPGRTVACHRWDDLDVRTGVIETRGQ